MDLLDLVKELEVDSPAANTVSPLRLLALGKYLRYRQQWQGMAFLTPVPSRIVVEASALRD